MMLLRRRLCKALQLLILRFNILVVHVDKLRRGNLTLVAADLILVHDRLLVRLKLIARLREPSGYGAIMHQNRR